MFRSDDSISGFSTNSVRNAVQHACRPPPRVLSWRQRFGKRAFDVSGALTFFILLAPLLIGIALLVGLTSGWPVHYRQTRLGLGGRPFNFYKFRSMVRNSDQALKDLLDRDPGACAEWKAFQHLRQDPRITPIGRYLRKYSLDELPQFWNVLIGDMSLVGPRPCMVRQASMFGDKWDHYCAMRPGISGLWQVSGRNSLTFAERVELDAKYVDEWSFWLDLSILLRTFRAVMAGD